jgi:hypothetical protein
MRTEHRIASHAKRAPLPRWFLPRLTPSQQTTCKVIHWDLITRITGPAATKDDMLEWIANALTYSQMMALLIEDGREFTTEACELIAEQVLLVPKLVDRYRATGKVGFTGPELQVARAAAYVMDDVITLDRHGIADQAARWSVEQMRRIQVGPAQ